MTSFTMYTFGLYRKIGFLYSVVSVVFISGFINQVTCCLPTCTSEDMQHSLGLCQTVGQVFDKATETGNTTLVCQGLHDMYMCVGKERFQCLSAVEDSYQEYNEPPWDCQPSQDQVIIYQDMQRDACNQDKNLVIDIDLKNNQSNKNAKANSNVHDQQHDQQHTQSSSVRDNSKGANSCNILGIDFYTVMSIAVLLTVQKLL